MPKPTEAMREEAQRGLDLRKEYERGGMEVGVARTRDIVNNRDLLMETVRRMNSYFARHEVDKQGEGFFQGEEGYPSAGRIAWALWGGDAGQSWARRLSEQEDDRMDKRAAPNALSVAIMWLGMPLAAEEPTDRSDASKEMAQSTCLTAVSQ